MGAQKKTDEEGKQEGEEIIRRMDERKERVMMIVLGIGLGIIVVVHSCVAAALFHKPLRGGTSIEAGTEGESYADPDGLSETGAAEGSYAHLVGKYLYFGRYWQDDTNDDGVADLLDTKQGIKWQVLSVSKRNAYLIADQVLDCRPYHTELQEITWEGSELRKWLNKDFYNAAFISGEKDAIVPIAMVNDYGDNTVDRISLMGYEEVKDWSQLVAQGSEYAVHKGVYEAQNGNCCWWLRDIDSENGENNAADFLNADDGDVYYGDVDISYIGVRPVLCLNLDKKECYMRAES